VAGISRWGSGRFPNETSGSGPAEATGPPLILLTQASHTDEFGDRFDLAIVTAQMCVIAVRTGFLSDWWTAPGRIYVLGHPTNEHVTVSMVRDVAWRTREERLMFVTVALRALGFVHLPDSDTSAEPIAFVEVSRGEQASAQRSGPPADPTSVARQGRQGHRLRRVSLKVRALMVVGLAYLGNNVLDQAISTGIQAALQWLIDALA
jgi:hypothetical protein